MAMKCLFLVATVAVLSGCYIHPQDCDSGVLYLARDGGIAVKVGVCADRVTVDVSSDRRCCLKFIAVNCGIPESAQILTDDDPPEFVEYVYTAPSFSAKGFWEERPRFCHEKRVEFSLQKSLVDHVEVTLLVTVAFEDGSECEKEFSWDRAAAKGCAP